MIGGAVWFDLYRASAGWSFWWDVPVGLVAIVLVGAGQHQMSGLAHEAVAPHPVQEPLAQRPGLRPVLHVPAVQQHASLPLQHLAHHQFVNDPQRDPDVSQLKSSGHWLDFPVGKRAFLWTLLKQLWLPNLIRFIAHPRRLQRHRHRQEPVPAQGLEAVEGGGRRRRPVPAAASRRR